MNVVSFEWDESNWEDITHWLADLPDEDWVINSIANGIVFRHREDAVAFRLRFGL